MLVRIAALVAVDAAPISYVANLEAVSDLEIDPDQIRGVLAAVAPIVGTARIVSALSKIALGARARARGRGDRGGGRGTEHEPEEAGRAGLRPFRPPTSETSNRDEGGVMDSDNLVLVVGSYADAGAAADDFKALKAGQDAGEYQVVGAVVMNRDASGKVDVHEHGDGRTAGGAVLGGTAGLVVGLFAPPLLAATAIGAGIGAGLGALRKRHEEKKMGVDVEEYLPPGPRRSWRSSTTCTPTRSRTRSSSRTRGSTRRSTRATTRSCRRRSRSPPPKCRAQSPHRSRKGGPAHTAGLPARAREQTNEIQPKSKPHCRRGRAGADRRGLWLERRQFNDRRRRAPPPPRPGRAASARRSRPGRPR